MTLYAEALEAQIKLGALLGEPEGRALWRRVIEGSGSSRYVGTTIAATTDAVRYGECFAWNGETIAAVTGAAAGLHGWRLRLAVLPAMSGFFWLSSPPVLAAGSNPVRAMAWIATSTRPELPADAWVGAQSMNWDEVDGIFLAFFSLIDRVPVPTGFLRVAEGVSVDELMRPIEDGFEGTAPKATTMAKLRWFGAALEFLDQRILVASRRSLDRATRRRLERAGVEYVPAVRVVELRRRETVEREPDGSVPIEWSCRWIVRGHWRQQWCPAAREHRPVWITPYVKGPEDKPLKPPRATVFAVVR